MAGKAAPKLVGLDIGASGIRAVELKRDRKSGAYTIVKAASVDLPRGAVRNGVIAEPETVTKSLKRLWRKGRFSTRKVALGLADGGVLTRQMDLPWMPPDDFRSALRYQITDALPVDLSTVEIDYHLLGESQRKDDHGGVVELNRILIVAANTEAILGEARAVRKARLQPICADSAAFALIRSVCQGVLPSDDQVHAVADIGADQLTVVVHQGGQPRFIRTIANLGGDTATVAVAERVRIDADEAEALKRATGLNGPAPDIAPIAESSVFGGLAPGSPPPLDPQSVRHGRRPQPVGHDRDRRDPQLARLLPGVRSDRTDPDAHHRRPNRRARRAARADRDPDPPQREGHGPVGRAPRDEVDNEASRERHPPGRRHRPGHGR